MLELIVIYILGVLLVGGISAWSVFETEEQVTLLDLLKLIVFTLLSWVAVLLVVTFVASLYVERYCSKKNNQRRD